MPVDPPAPSPIPKVPGRALGQADSGVIVAAPQHRHPRVHVLRHRVLQEVLRREDRDIGTGIDNAQHPAEVIQVRVRVDHRGDRAVAPVSPVQGERRGGDLRRDQRVDHDDAMVAFDQRHVRHLEPADLVDAVGHLIQAVPGGQLGLPPQAGMNGVRAVAVQEAPAVHIPHHPAVRSLDHHRLQRADEAPVSVGEITAVAEIGTGRPGPRSLLRHLTPPDKTARQLIRCSHLRARLPGQPDSRKDQCPARPGESSRNQRSAQTGPPARTTLPGCLSSTTAPGTPAVKVPSVRPGQRQPSRGTPAHDPAPDSRPAADFRQASDILRGDPHNCLPQWSRAPCRPGTDQPFGYGMNSHGD